MKFDPFDLTGYPHSGEMIGPAWRVLMDELSDRDWHSMKITVAKMRLAGGIAYKTACNRINQGCKLGLLEKKWNRDTSSKWIRFSSEGYWQERLDEYYAHLEGRR